MIPSTSIIHLEWCQSSWVAAYQHCKVFSDESNFNLGTDDHCTHVWGGLVSILTQFLFYRGTQSLLLVWWWRILSLTTSDRSGIILTQQYIDKVLKKFVSIFMTCHGTFSNMIMSGSQWIAYLCIALATKLPGQHVTKCWSGQPTCDRHEGHNIRSPSTIANMEQQLRNAYQNLSQSEIRTFYHSLPRCMQTCIATRGAAFPI